VFNLNKYIFFSLMIFFSIIIFDLFIFILFYKKSLMSQNIITPKIRLIVFILCTTLSILGIGLIKFDINKEFFSFIFYFINLFI
jgi:hypothetical protein